MRVFVAGATGAIGRPLLEQLRAAGHQVTGLTRRESKRGLIESLGARAAVADALDREAVGRVVIEAEPEAIVHQMTAIEGVNPRRLDRDFALTNRLRTEGTDNLLAAAKAAAVGRFVAQSFVGWPYARVGGLVKTEDDPLDTDTPKPFRETLAAIKRLERAVGEASFTEGLVLRYGFFHGPGTSLALSPAGDQVKLVRARKLPLVGDGAGVWSFVEVSDAAAAAVAALERGAPGIYNIVDDEPVAIARWLPALAAAVGAKPPLRVPRWLGRIVGGEGVVVMMTDVRGASNAKAKRELGWSPAHPSFVGELAARSQAQARRSSDG